MYVLNYPLKKNVCFINNPCCCLDEPTCKCKDLTFGFGGACLDGMCYVTQPSSCPDAYPGYGTDGAGEMTSRKACGMFISNINNKEIINPGLSISYHILIFHKFLNISS